jgi:hypothetical protein
VVHMIVLDPRLFSEAETLHGHEGRIEVIANG